jgi:hypothetical protein
LNMWKGPHFSNLSTQVGSACCFESSLGTSAGKGISRAAEECRTNISGKIVLTTS